MDKKLSNSAAEPSVARRRLLDTATRLFYAEGIRAVGIDRIIAEAGVAKATFYNHFPSKDDLVLAYVEEQDEIGRAAVAGLPNGTPRETIDAVMRRISSAVGAPDWRGCPFINAAAEYPDRTSPVRQAIAARRAWYDGMLRKLLVAHGDPTPAVTASLLVALSDGLLEAGYLDDPKLVAAQTRDGVARIVDRR